MDHLHIDYVQVCRCMVTAQHNLMARITFYDLDTDEYKDTDVKEWRQA